MAKNFYTERARKLKEYFKLLDTTLGKPATAAKTINSAQDPKKPSENAAAVT